jgi:hypothetical protein
MRDASPRTWNSPADLLLTLSHGVTALGRQGASKAEVKAVGRFIYTETEMMSSSGKIRSAVGVSPVEAD